MVEIQTADGYWTDRIHLPSANLTARLCVKADATYQTVIHYEDRQVKISRGAKLLFKCVKGNTKRRVEWNHASQLDYARTILPFSTLSGKLTGLIGAPTQLLLHTIDIGMLTTPLNEFSFQGSIKFSD